MFRIILLLSLGTFVINHRSAKYSLYSFWNFDSISFSIPFFDYVRIRNMTQKTSWITMDIFALVLLIRINWNYSLSLFSIFSVIHLTLDKQTIFFLCSKSSFFFLYSFCYNEIFIPPELTTHNFKFIFFFCRYIPVNIH